jgi:hypothetical protein
MSGDARMLRTLIRFLALDQRPGYAAAIEREHMMMRCRLLAKRIIEGRA